MAAAVGASVLGTAAATTGIIIAVDQFGAGGWWRAAVGAVVGVAGVVASVRGVGTAWRMTRRWWRLLAIPVAVLHLCFVVYPVAIAVVATGQSRAELGSRRPVDVGLDARDVTFRTADGVTLAGWWVAGTNGISVVLLHGASSTRTAVLDHAAALHREGFGVLMFDARGHGRSGGEAMDLGWYGDLDVVAAVDHLVQRPDVDPERIAVVGLSMGGEEAIGAMAADQRIKAVVAEGATNRTVADRDDWLPRGPAGLLQRAMDRVTFALVDLLTHAGPPRSLRDSAAMAAPRPLLLIAGSGEEDAARSIQRGAPTTVDIWRTDVGHTRGLAEFPTEWLERVTSFLHGAMAS